MQNYATTDITADDRAITRKGIELQNGQYKRLMAHEIAASVDHKAAARDAFATAKRRIRSKIVPAAMRRENARDALRSALRHMSRA